MFTANFLSEKIRVVAIFHNNLRNHRILVRNFEMFFKPLNLGAKMQTAAIFYRNLLKPLNLSQNSNCGHISHNILKPLFKIDSLTVLLHCVDSLRSTIIILVVHVPHFPCKCTWMSFVVDHTGLFGPILYFSEPKVWYHRSVPI